MEELLRMEQIYKTFPGVKALDGVNIVVNAGEVHALLGENGAGKSTLMKILNGVEGYKPDSGKIYVRGKAVEINSINDAHKLGIGIIFQEISLCPDLTVSDNVFMGRYKRRGIFADGNYAAEETQKILSRFGLDMIHPRDIVRTMSIAQMQMVEICKALSRNSDIIVFDEPTAALAETEIEKLFEIIHELKAQGKGIIYISHRMEELARIADVVTVLRDGAQIGASFAFNSISLNEIINRMVGRPLENKYPQHTRNVGEVFFTVKNLKNRKCAVHDLELRRGEILGIAGLMGAGRTEMARAIVGADPSENIEITMDGKPLKITSPKAAMRYGIVYLTENRKTEGLALGMNCERNINMSSMKKLSKMGFVRAKFAMQNARRFARDLSIKTPGLYQTARLLSGGNQQKLVVAKYLSHGARVMIFDEPTRGIDVGAKYEIYKLINQLSDEGVGIIMISSELPELLGMSDRIAFMHEGQVVGEMKASETNQAEILSYIAGLKTGCGEKENA